MDAVNATLVVFVVCVILLSYLTKNKNYWKNLGVPYVSPFPILGNLKPLIFLEKSPGPFLGELYNSGPGHNKKFLGIFLFNCEPALLIKDPQLIKRILIQDFHHFNNRNVNCNPRCDPIGVKNLFVIRDDKWKYLRAKLSPTFTTGKLKQMFVVIKESVRELINVIDEGIESNKEGVTVELRELLAKYTTDVINICAFGITSNSLRDPHSQFRYFGKKIFNTGIKRSIETRSFFFMHFLASTFRFVFFEKESSKFMKNVFAEIMRERENKGLYRNDFIDLLIQLKQHVLNSNSEQCTRSVVDEESVLAQAALFYTAGFETTSVTIMFTLLELALHPEIQERLRREIVESVEENGGNLDYDTLLHMTYLHMVISETLRKYPPMPFIDRVCTKDYPIPECDVVIKKGTPIFISLYKGLHYDEKYFPEPEKFDPDRFGHEGKATTHPHSYLPFGEGPHVCLGMRFGLINTKTAICLLLSKYKIQCCDASLVPIEISARSIILNTKHELFLKFVPFHEKTS